MSGCQVTRVDAEELASFGLWDMGSCRTFIARSIWVVVTIGGRIIIRLARFRSKAHLDGWLRRLEYEICVWGKKTVRQPKRILNRMEKKRRTLRRRGRYMLAVR